MYNIKEMPEYLYHLTSVKHLDLIFSHGLDPQFSKSSLSAVFLALYPDIAENYRMMYSDDTVLLKIKTSFLKEKLMGPDNYELRDFLESNQNKTKYTDWNDVPYLDSLKLCGQLAYYGIIHSDAVTLFKS